MGLLRARSRSHRLRIPGGYRGESGNWPGAPRNFREHASQHAAGRARRRRAGPATPGKHSNRILASLAEVHRSGGHASQPELKLRPKSKDARSYAPPNTSSQGVTGARGRRSNARTPRCPPPPTRPARRQRRAQAPSAMSSSSAFFSSSSSAFFSSSSSSSSGNWKLPRSR